MHLPGSLASFPVNYATVLRLVKDRGELCGLEIVKASKGRIRTKDVYVILQRLSAKGLLQSRKERRDQITWRYHSITQHGVRVLDAWDTLREVSFRRKDA